MIINPYLVQPSVPAFTGLLDTYSGAAAAYSAARRLSSTYTGALIRVRRSSDNTEQDIGYDSNNVLDESALTSFVGANSGYVTTWYDQSGNGKNATQSTAANQPRIVNAGTIEKLNNKPALYYDGSDDRLSTASITWGTSYSFIGAFSVIDTNNYGKIYAIGADQSSNGYALSTLAGASVLDWQADDTLALGSGYNSTSNPRIISNGKILNDNTQYLLFLNLSSTASNMYKNGTEISYRVQTTGNTDSNSNILYIGASDTNAQTYKGNPQELIFYASNQNANKSGIQSNINTFYSIY